MTCHRVPLTPSLCTCGAVLDITQWHDDDEQGNPLCPTCSGCGCEPNERNLMNEPTDEQVAAFKRAWHRADIEGRAGERVRDGLRAAALPVPAPDHSMCARPDPSLRRAVQEAIGEASVCWDNMSGAGAFDVARANAVADRLCAILDIPEPEPSVVERAAKVLADELPAAATFVSSQIAQALADAGLLVKDGGTDGR